MAGDRVTKILLLVVAAVLTGALGIVQWFELLSADQNGAFCQVGEQFDCLAVWQSGPAKTIHRLTKIPLAGWGVVWAVGAFGSALFLVAQALKGSDPRAAHGAVRLFAAAGVLTSLGLFGVTVSLGVFCLTCVATYILVLAYAGAAFRLSNKAGWVWPQSVAAAAALVVVGYLLVLAPGLRTPTERPAFTPPTPAASNGQPERAALSNPEDPVAQVFLRLPAARRAQVKSAWQQTQQDSGLAGSSSPTALTGKAPVRLLEFVDAKCPHCRILSESITKIEASVPEGLMERITRVFPLDAECNPLMPPEATDGSGTRCAAAGVITCIQDEALKSRVMDSILQSQNDLTPERVFSLAAEGSGAEAAELEACAGRRDSAARVQENLQQALSFKLHGTPMVLVNGRRVPPIPELIYALVLAKGDFKHPGFAALAN